MKAHQLEAINDLPTETSKSLPQHSQCNRVFRCMFVIQEDVVAHDQSMSEEKEGVVIGRIFIGAKLEKLRELLRGRQLVAKSRELWPVVLNTFRNSQRR